MTIKVAIFAPPDVQALDVFGPMDVFAEANRFLAPDVRYSLTVIGLEAGAVRCSNGALLQPHLCYADATDDFDFLLVAGGPLVPSLTLNLDFNAWLRRTSDRCRRFGSICNGAFILAKAGLIAGHSVTTHWSDAEALANLCPDANVQFDSLYVCDGRLHTSAGVTAGIDLALFLVAKDHGKNICMNVAKRLVVFMQRTGGQSQFSPHLTPFIDSNSTIHEIQLHILSNLSSDLGLGALAEVVHMSSRNFSRVFVRETGKTPAEFVELARIDAARRLLEQPFRPLKAVAADCGFRDGQHMRDVFRRRLGVSPLQYRLSFGSRT